MKLQLNDSADMSVQQGREILETEGELQVRRRGLNTPNEVGEPCLQVPMLAGHQVPKHEFQGGEPITEDVGQIVVGLAVPEGVGESTSVHFSHKSGSADAVAGNGVSVVERGAVVQWWPRRLLGDEQVSVLVLVGDSWRR